MYRIFAVAIVACLFAAVPWARATTCADLAAPNPVGILCDNFESYADNNAFWASWTEQTGCHGIRASDHLDPHAEGFNGAVDGSGGKWIWVAQQSNDQQVTIYNYVKDLQSQILGMPGNAGQIPSVNGAGDISKPTEWDSVNQKLVVPAGYVDSMSRTARPYALRGQYLMYWPGSGGFANGLWYYELSMDNDHAPYNWTMTRCVLNNTAKNQPVLVLPGDGQVHKAFAIGMVATIDRNPCDLDTGTKPSINHLVVYDGLNWNMCRASATGFDIVDPVLLGHPELEHKFELTPQDGPNWVQFAIGATHIEVRLRTALSESYRTQGIIPNGYWQARFPRQYVGPFNKISLGADSGMDQTVPTCDFMGTTTCQGGTNNGIVCDSATDCPGGTCDYGSKACNGGSRNMQTCTTAADCPAEGSPRCPTIPGSNDFWVDAVELYDGTFAGPPSACCKPDRTCSLLDEPGCTAVGGTLKSGITSCSPNPCCPTPWADYNQDTSVDMLDFAELQKCLTIGTTNPTLSGPCKCYDRPETSFPDGNGAIDMNDVQKFVDCAGGPGIPVVNCP